MGFLFLPFLWAVNTVWFFKEAFFKAPYNEQKQIKKCKIYNNTVYPNKMINFGSGLILTKADQSTYVFITLYITYHNLTDRIIWNSIKINFTLEWTCL